MNFCRESAVVWRRGGGRFGWLAKRRREVWMVGEEIDFYMEELRISKYPETTVLLIIC